LNQSGLPFIELGGVKPNPLRSLVEKGLKMAHKEGVDFFLAVGGGSSIDTAKGIALGLANDDNYWQFYNGTVAEKMAPVGTIHTIAAAGSETSGSSVLVDDIDGGRKHGFLCTYARPVFAIMNPELT
jgi:alcohol dehydrogenase YqhD (iron-dependent ADH family)